MCDLGRCCAIIGELASTMCTPSGKPLVKTSGEIDRVSMGKREAMFYVALGWRRCGYVARSGKGGERPTLGQICIRIYVRPCVECDRVACF